MRRDVLITGIGVVTRDAIGVGKFADWMANGGGLPSSPAIFDAEKFRSSLAYLTDPASVHAALAERMRAFGTDPEAAPPLNCATYGLLATLEALAGAGLVAGDLENAGLALATTSGSAMDQFAEAYSEGLAPVDDVLQNLRPSSAAVAIARTAGLGGPFANFSCACASSAVAISYALSRVRSGDAPIMIAGGCDQVRRADFAGFNALRAMDREACRPFDMNRRGMMMGDGSAILILEDADHALARGAEPFARICGAGLTADAFHITAPDPSGISRAMRQAIADANVERDDVAYVNCHGTGTPANDSAELEAMSTIYGDSSIRPMISSTKGTTGHFLGTAAALEAVVSVLALQTRQVPPMASTISPVATQFPMPVHDAPTQFVGDVAMSNSLGFGGLNVSLIFKSAPGVTSAKASMLEGNH